MNSETANYNIIIAVLCGSSVAETKLREQRLNHRSDKACWILLRTTYSDNKFCRRAIEVTYTGTTSLQYCFLTMVENTACTNKKNKTKTLIHFITSFVEIQSRVITDLFSCCSYSGSPSFTEGRCPGNKAPIFNQSMPFATAPIVNLSNGSFTISCWVKQTKWSPGEIGVIYGDWHPPWQFLLSTINQSIEFHRHTTGSEEWFSLQSNNVSLRAWTHVVVTWHNDTGTVLIYADGKEIGRTRYALGETFYGPTSEPYKIGNDGVSDNHQFHGSVMDLYVFDQALSPYEVATLRGTNILELLTNTHVLK